MWLAELKLIWDTWKLALLATVIASLTVFGLVQTWRLKTCQSEIKEVKVIEKIADEQAEKNYETLKDAIPVMEKQITERAWANAKRKFGTCNAAGGVRADSVLPAFSGGEAPAPSRTEEGGERVGIPRPTLEALGRDVGRLKLLIKACDDNPLICEFK